MPVFVITSYSIHYTKLYEFLRNRAQGQVVAQRTGCVEAEQVEEAEGADDRDRNRNRRDDRGPGGAQELV